MGVVVAKGHRQEVFAAGEDCPAPTSVRDPAAAGENAFELAAMGSASELRADV
ncbi:hypothetical protein AB0283_09645 [Micromonospora vinacea]|uniref:hypothetical protein n=1 Tax=Micromonospora vinacea TaxID=709878 RepID=UPI00344B4912